MVDIAAGVADLPGADLPVRLLARRVHPRLGTVAHSVQVRVKNIKGTESLGGKLWSQLPIPFKVCT